MFCWVCIGDTIVIYEALQGDFPSLATHPRTAESQASMVVLQLFIIKQRMLWGFVLVSFLLGV